MTTQEARIVSPGKPKIGARPPAGGAPAPEGPAGGEGGGGGGKKRLMSIVIGVLIVIIAVGAYWFLMGPGAAGEDPAAAADGAVVEEEVHEEEVESGGVQVVESISINLEQGHYLRLGLGLEVSAEAVAHGEIGEAIALDAAIALFSGRTQDELSDPEIRDELKHELAETLKEAYHGEVIGVYYTDFVTQ
ncbi:flagellar basal body-associated FliL family protein [Demequina zhanjiangensis]|uniref:Flagellar protein FliL n=1 Tax=Demequina zhanjiangensis TaxID=3051659 RepID=A0ABT8FZP8_9MICO|nr:flagellar basal body-associated FliL family protein [Demequina sp. SYSU T00b26]MDN4472366.1 flagellar basal body-associated FliL family protein [Demequina sp. SYSU T00b26]